MNKPSLDPIPSSHYILLGITRGLIGFPLEHPFVVAKLKNQGLPYFNSLQVIKSIYLAHGFTGFYAGSIPSLFKRAVKEGYRWPSLAFFHTFWHKVLPGYYPYKDLVITLLTASCIASLETILILPLERLTLSKIHEQGYCRFFKERFKKEGFVSLYHSFSATFFRHITVWTSFMVTNLIVKTQLNKINYFKNHSLQKQVLANVLIAANLTLFGMPLDFIRIQIQLDPTLQKRSLKIVIPLLFQRYGWKGFYKGALFAFLHTNVQALLSGTLLDKITQQSK